MTSTSSSAALTLPNEHICFTTILYDESLKLAEPDCSHLSLVLLSRLQCDRAGQVCWDLKEEGLEAEITRGKRERLNGDRRGRNSEIIHTLKVKGMPWSPALVIRVSCIAVLVGLWSATGYTCMY